MTTLKKESINTDLIKEMYHLDTDFISYFPDEYKHDVNKCIEKSLKEFEQAKSELDFYEVLDNNDIIGYFAIQRKTFLFTFFINPKYRTKEISSKFWKEIIQKAEFPFFTSMYNRNPRALKFLQKQNGKEIYQGMKNNELFYMYKFEQRGNS